MSQENRSSLFTFVKLNVADINAMTRFFEDGFGLTHADTVDTTYFREHMMAGKKGSMTVVLFHSKTDEPIVIGNGWGPLGMITRDLDADLTRALDAGARQEGETVQFGPTRIAFVLTPEGHEIELMQMSAS